MRAHKPRVLALACSCISIKEAVMKLTYQILYYVLFVVIAASYGAMLAQV